MTGRAIAPITFSLMIVAGCAHRPAERSTATLRIYLARHGQTAWNAMHRIQGSIDTELNDPGLDQAAKLRDRLAGIPIDAVYSSTLRRSRQTAEIVRGNRPLESLAALCERRFGKFEGFRTDTTDTALVSEYERRSRDPIDALGTGESEDQFFARVRGAIETIRSRHPSGTILIVGHGGTNQMIIRDLLGLTAEQAQSIHQANDELYLIELTPGIPSRLWKAIGLGNLKEL